jgi:deoxyribodipyrimidine photo-lyase
MSLFSDNEFENAVDFPTDYDSIIARIECIDPIQYSKTRNFTNGAVTYLSPYISRGVISTKQVLDIVLKKGYASNQLEKFIQELAWREYYQRVWQSIGDAIWQDIKQPQPDVAHHTMLVSIENATTGVNAIDHNIAKLYTTGYMHNHVRMYTAAIACNVGKAHWLQPSKWLYYHLLDGDIASNNCSWQWVAGSFSSKRYYCNQENINTYCNSSQHGTFLDVDYEALPTISLPESLKETMELKLVTQLPDKKNIQLDTSLTLLLYNSYNLDPLWRKETKANRLLLLEPSHFKKYPVSAKVIDFVLKLSKNIDGIQIFIGEIDEIPDLKNFPSVYSKKHPAFDYYVGTKDEPEWMFPSAKASGSFSSFWKACERNIIQ